MSDDEKAKQSWKHSHDKKGAYKRKESVFRKWVKAGDTEHPPEANRYHLYVSYACPWAHRTLVMRALKGLEDMISFTVVDHFLGPKGWKFDPKDPDPHHNFEYLRQVYEDSDPNYDGNITVPVLYDIKKNVIVNNESSEIIRMLNSEFNSLLPKEKAELDFFKEDQRDAIEAINKWVYPTVNNGVYRCGFAKSQEAYSTAFKELHDSLRRVEDILSKNRYLIGDHFTEADIRLFTTLIRFDPVYFVHFKTNGFRIKDLPNTWEYMKEIYQMPGVAETFNLEHIKKHYYASHDHINPFRIVPRGPLGYEEALKVPHNRGK